MVLKSTRRQFQNSQSQYTHKSKFINLYQERVEMNDILIIAVCTNLEHSMPAQKCAATCTRMRINLLKIRALHNESISNF